MLTVSWGSCRSPTRRVLLRRQREEVLSLLPLALLLTLCICTIVVLEHVLGSSRQSIAITVGLSPMEVGEGIDVTFDPVVEVSTEEKQALRDAVESCLTRGRGAWHVLQCVAIIWSFYRSSARVPSGGCDCNCA